eukprot:scaffold7514_cov239-Pinguiococcus_pyrenoidosus.AAC.1
MDNAIERLFRTSRVLQLVVILGSSPMAPKETVVVDFTGVLHTSGDGCDPVDAKLLHQYSRKAVLGILRQTEAEPGPDATLRRRVRTPSLCNVLARVGDAQENVEAAGDFIFQPCFELRPPRKSGRNPHLRIELGCRQRTSDAASDSASIDECTWWKCKVRVRGLRQAF